MPIAVDTVISPDESPLASGSRMIKLRPSSSTVVVKSVPRIAIFAVGVRIEMFSLFILPRPPVTNRAVPLAKLSARVDFDGSGSKMYSVISNFECSVSLTTESSRNVIATRPLAVSTLSFCCIGNSSSASKGSSRTTLAKPCSSVMPPISASDCCASVILDNAHSASITSRVNL